MKGSPKAAATRRPTADLPEPAGPSMATIIVPSLLLPHLPPPSRWPGAGRPARRDAADARCRAGGGPGQPLYRVPDRGQHPADLMVASLHDHQAYAGPSRPTVEQLRLGGKGAPVLELHPTAKGFQ